MAEKKILQRLEPKKKNLVEKKMNYPSKISNGPSLINCALTPAHVGMRGKKLSSN